MTKNLNGVEVSEIYRSDAEETPEAFVVAYEPGGGGADLFKFDSERAAVEAIDKAKAEDDYRADNLNLYSIQEFVARMDEE